MRHFWTPAAVVFKPNTCIVFFLLLHTRHCVPEPVSSPGRVRSGSTGCGKGGGHGSRLGGGRWGRGELRGWGRMKPKAPGVVPNVPMSVLFLITGYWTAGGSAKPWPVLQMEFQISSRPECLCASAARCLRCAYSAHLPAMHTKSGI